MAVTNRHLSLPLIHACQITDGLAGDRAASRSGSAPRTRRAGVSGLTPFLSQCAHFIRGRPTI